MNSTDIKTLNSSARKVHGADTSIQVARAVAWGNDDTLILVHGRNHRLAAADIARAAMCAGNKPTVKEEPSSTFMGQPTRAYSTVQFA